MIHMMASGQSLQLGTDETGHFDLCKKVKVWDNLQDITSNTASLGTQWKTPVRSQIPFRTNGENAPQAHAASDIALATGDDVRLVACACGATYMASWFDQYGTSGPMWARMVAVWTAAGANLLDIFVWDHGVASNAPASYLAAYPAEFAHLIAAMETAGMIDANTAIVICEQSAPYTDINAVLHAIAAGDDRMAVANNVGLPTWDGTHFTGAASPYYGRNVLKALSETVTQFQGIYTAPDYVIAGGYGVSFSIPANTAKKVPVTGFYGNLDWIVGDRFVCPKDGSYQFTTTTMADGAPHRQWLITDSGSLWAQVAYGGMQEPSNNNSLLRGGRTLRLSEGDTMWLGVQHALSGGTTLASGITSEYMRMEITYLGPL